MLAISSEYIKLSITLTLLLGLHTSYSQTNSFSVSLAPFSTLANDEFSPVYYNNGLVFCSNLKNNSLILYQGSQGKLFNIFYVPIRDSIKLNRATILARELTTNFNDGPATFNREGNIIYFSRNNEIGNTLRNLMDSSNRMGIYSAALVDGVWENIKPFEHNNPLYSLLTPALAPDGNRLYFASDMPGGQGGTDLYYSDWDQEGWGKPINLGSTINTQGNESFPFACSTGKLFFASDGHGGYGGKDIFYTQEIDGEWIDPIHLDAEINSRYDDFGLVTDEFLQTGYFSSNRRGPDDIYSFTLNPIQFTHCDSLVRNRYCFLFYDEYINENDSIPVLYEWHFSEGRVKQGIRVKHCFPGPGSYEVRLVIRDSVLVDSTYGATTYRFDLKDVEQVYIDSPDSYILDSLVQFNGLKTNLKGFQVSDYLWDFGDGFRTRGPLASKRFSQTGEYTVRLGLLGERDSLGNLSQRCGYKRVRIFEDYQELAKNAAQRIDEVEILYTDIVDRELGIGGCKQAEADYPTNQDPDSKAFGVLVYLLNNLTESQRQLIVSKLHGISGCTFTMGSNGFDIFSTHLLNNLIDILQADNTLRLEVALHTSESSSARRSLERTEDWLGRISQFFVSRGGPNERIRLKGYGNSRPFDADGKSSDPIMMIRRVEFIFHY